MGRGPAAAVGAVAARVRGPCGGHVGGARRPGLRAGGAGGGAEQVPGGGAAPSLLPLPPAPALGARGYGQRRRPAPALSACPGRAPGGL